MAKHQMKWLFIADNSKENVESAATLDINCSNVKIREIKMAVVTVEMRVEVFCTYCCKPEHMKQNCLKLKRKDS
jgi:hypothetical protein